MSINRSVLRPARGGRVWLAAALIPGLLLAFAQPAAAADPNAGRAVYTRHCQNCHGASGVGQLPSMPDFSRGERLFKPDAELMETIRTGRGMMPAYRGLLSDEELLDVVAFLRTLRK